MAAPSANVVQLWLRKHQQVSESAFATTIGEAQSERWRFNTDEGYWLQWVGTHWARYQTPEFLDAVRHFMTEFSRGLRRAEVITNAEAVKFQSQRTVAAVERMCRALPIFLTRSSAFDADWFLLGTPGGTIDLRTGVMTPPNPADLITLLTTCAPAPVGTPLGPRFVKFLDDITAGDKDFQLTLQMWFGISASGTARDQRILFLYGSGGNGKGVLLRTVAGTLGGYAVDAPRDLLMLERYSQHTTHLIDVVRSRMAIATEVDDDSTWDVALIKNLTGGDVMKVNRMRHDPFPVTPSCSLTVAGNRKPMLKEVDEAIRRRFLVATFALKITPDQVIVDLEKQFIAEEGPAILRWIIDGAVAREQAGRLHVAKVILDDTEDYFAEENVMQDFIGMYLIATPEFSDPIQKEKTSNVYNAWKTYCRLFGHPVGARNSFTTAMKNAGIKYQRTESGRYFLNVRLKETAEL